MPGSCSLTMPLLLDGINYGVTMESQGIVCEVAFECEKQSLRVRLLIPHEHDAQEHFMG